jgi:hypothetical protein
VKPFSLTPSPLALLLTSPEVGFTFSDPLPKGRWSVRESRTMNRRFFGDLVCYTVAAPLVRAVRARRLREAHRLAHDVHRVERLLRAVVAAHPYVAW